MTRDEEILDVIRVLDEGEVVTYGDIAAQAGYPGRSRLVGHVLASTPEDVPWWRVVNAAGRLVPGSEREQAALLRAEGVTVADGKVRAAPTGRFAPSPTGLLHAGSLVAALASWLDVRARGPQARWLVRIVDADTGRCLPGLGERILAQLATLGLWPDAPPV